MKRLYTYAALILALFILPSCEKVIELDLNEVEKKYVIEAVVSDQPESSRVRITQTVDFDQPSSYPAISNAVVTVTEQGGGTTVLTELQPGLYTSPGLIGESGKTYALSVTIGSQVFTAVSRMPQRINIDSLFITDELLFTDIRKVANVVYQDPVGKGNCYKFNQYVDDQKQMQIIVQNDDYTDGRNVFNKLFYFADEEDGGVSFIKSGSKVDVEMICIDPAIYRYWFSLARSATGTSGQATPANPVSNLLGGALGYFSAETFQSRTVIAP